MARNGKKFPSQSEGGGARIEVTSLPRTCCHQSPITKHQTPNTALPPKMPDVQQNFQFLFSATGHVGGWLSVKWDCAVNGIFIERQIVIKQYFLTKLRIASTIHLSSHPHQRPSGSVITFPRAVDFKQNMSL
jgi:hypothetical protein